MATDAGVAGGPAVDQGHVVRHDSRGMATAAVRGATWLSGERWVNQALAALVFVALGRLVAPSAFGLIAAANVLVLLFRVLVDGGFSRALVQLPVIEVEDVDTAFWTSIAMGVLLAIVAAAGAPLIAALFGEPQLRLVVVVLSPVFLLAALDSTQSALVDRAMKFRVQAIRRTVATVLSSIAALAVAATGGGVWALVAQTLTYESLLVALLWALTEWRPRMRWSRNRAGSLLRLGAGLTGVRLMLYVTTNADNLLVGVVLGPVALGLYTVAYRVLLVLFEMTGQTLVRVTVPVFARCQSDLQRLQRAFLEGCELGLLVALPLFVGLAVIGDLTLPMLFGPRWHNAGRVVQVLALAGVVYVPTGLLQNIVTTANRVGAEVRWSVVSTAVLVVAFVVSVHFGVTAVALSLGVTVGLLLPVRMRWVAMQGLLPADTPRLFYACLLRLAGPGAGMAAAMAAIKTRTDGWPALEAVSLAAAIGAIVYVAAIRLFAPRSWRLVIEAVRHLTGRRRPAVASKAA